MQKMKYILSPALVTMNGYMLYFYFPNIIIHFYVHFNKILSPPSLYKSLSKLHVRADVPDTEK